MLEGFDATTLARIQFGFTISFHIIFPAFSIGLASYLFVLEGLWLKTRDRDYLELFDFWKAIFAVAFGMGVVSGVVLSYQFGTNWSVFSDKAGPVIGPMMGYEVLTAFFLEAGFLGIMLFGLPRVGEGLHFMSTGLVALGTLISATWIVAANSWMQTPAGFSVNMAGQFAPIDWWKAVFSPSFPYRAVHMVLAAYLTTSLVVGAVGAWHLLHKAAPPRAAKMFSMAMWMATIVAPIQIFAGDQHGLNTLEYQPTKVMAMEGHFESHPHGAPLVLFGIPNQDEQRIDYAVSVPHLSSLILTHSWNGPLTGLNTVPRQLQPPVAVVFWSFRVMVGLGVTFLALGVWSLWNRYRGTLFTNRWLLRAAVVMGPTGFVAVLAGWITTEVGRQPFTVYGHLLTAHSASPVHPAGVAASLIAFIVVYFCVYAVGTFYIVRLMATMPQDTAEVLSDAPIRATGIVPGPALSIIKGRPHEY
ncbi:cytochrome ubiquinol oxidase subunit I (plasmid) [Rhizobium sp. CC1099]|uniref:cytochrome ubiquinol oxidase subunit I n=1 Tax=Rhizobium sp. CC1099 TaxID=3039160 RepID=UPI0024B22677|nr:cytochrome ubiquinol oxidase subunit I [Rhizobium sp. CC1099]WFU91415.1 cytochrome ubiquinol oxidase subunit I [Rhizobium sp. CC1099]